MRSNYLVYTLTLKKEPIITISKNGSTISFKNLNLKTKSIYIETHGTKADIYGGRIDISDSFYKYDKITVNHFLFNPKSNTTNNTITASISPAGYLKNLYLVFYSAQKDFTISNITLNKKLPLTFNFLRFFLFFFFFATLKIISFYKLYRIPFDNKNIFHKFSLALACLLCMFASSLIFKYTNLFDSISYLPQTTYKQLLNPRGIIDYPLLDDVKNYSNYIQLFNAFKTGHLYLWKLPKTKDIDIYNNYDPSERLKNNNFDGTWDRAFFNKKFYSYFGLTPLIIYYVFFWMTKSLPSDPIVSFILANLSIFFIFGAIKELAIFYCKKFNIVPLIFLSITAVFSSTVYLTQSCIDFYYMTAQCAVAFLASSIYFAFKGYNNLRHSYLRTVYFLLSAISILLLFQSRYSVILTAFAFIAPKLFAILFSKLRFKVSCLLCFFIPIIIGFIMFGAYNYFRFNSPFNLGAIYQLTSYNISQHSFTLLNSFQGLLIGFFTLPAFTTSFPFINTSIPQILTGNFVSILYTIGAFSFPLNWGIFFLGAFLSKRHLLKSITYLSVIISTIVIVIVTFNFAGTDIRYLSDISLSLSLITSLMLLETITSSKGLTNVVMYKITTFICITSCIIGFLLIFSNERNYIKELAPDTYLSVQRSLSFIK